MPADDSAASLKVALAEGTRELAEAREREAATAEVLKVISASRGELDPVFDAILGDATRWTDQSCRSQYSATTSLPQQRFFSLEVSVNPAFS